VRYPKAMAKALRAAHLGRKADEMEPTEDEELGYLVLADAIQCLTHLRDAYTKR
jgi:hypothetical protein